jgi:endonuclease/exonuclease/phosphatase family metal-dependent hydrolase
VHVQNLGFAVRKGLPFQCGPELTRLSLEDDVRRGVELRLFPGTAREMRFLSVHLKSGCSRDALDSERPSCGKLATQVPELEQWIDVQAAARIPFAVLGDFNRDLRRESATASSVWSELDDADPPDADLVNTAEGKEFQNCSPSQTFSGYIDYIVLGRRMARGLVDGSFGRELFRPKDALRRKMSDHCPVFIRLRVADATSLMP